MRHIAAHPAELTWHVERELGDQREATEIDRVLGERRWDVAVCTAGRLRLLADDVGPATIAALPAGEPAS